ncbi:MAG: hypothetical protein AB7J32_01930 [Pseudonocardia sp.]
MSLVPGPDTAVLATVTEIARAGLPFLWLGSALVILFLEINLSLHLGICQQAFRALHVGEIVLAAILTMAVLADTAPSLASVTLILALWAVLGGQAVLLRSGSGSVVPELRREKVDPDPVDRPGLYRRLEVVKLVGLAVLGCVLVAGLAG